MRNNPLLKFLLCILYAGLALFCSAYLVIGSFFTGGALEKAGFDYAMPAIVGAILTALLVIIRLYQEPGFLSFSAETALVYSIHLL
jgi:hypothetical protein